jgi:hypothetical protein
MWSLTPKDQPSIADKSRMILRASSLFIGSSGFFKIKLGSLKLGGLNPALASSLLIGLLLCGLS